MSDTKKLNRDPRWALLQKRPRCVSPDHDQTRLHPKDVLVLLTKESRQEIVGKKYSDGKWTRDLIRQWQPIAGLSTERNEVSGYLGFSDGAAIKEQAEKIKKMTLLVTTSKILKIQQPPADTPFVGGNSEDSSTGVQTGTHFCRIDDLVAADLFIEILKNRIDVDAKPHQPSLKISGQKVVFGGYADKTQGYSNVQAGDFNVSLQKYLVFTLEKTNLNIFKRSCPQFRDFLDALSGEFSKISELPGSIIKPMYADFLFQNNNHMLFDYHKDNDARSDTQALTNLTSTTLITPRGESTSMHVLGFPKAATYTNCGDTHFFDGEFSHCSVKGSLRTLKVTVFWSIDKDSINQQIGQQVGELHKAIQEAPESQLPEDEDCATVPSGSDTVHSVASGSDTDASPAKDSNDVPDAGQSNDGDAQASQDGEKQNSDIQEDENSAESSS